MAAKVSVIWRDKAKDGFNKSVQWCVQEFGERVAANFYRRVKQEVGRLAYAPYIGSLELLLPGNVRSYRSLPVRPHFRLIYYVDESQSELHIVDFWDVRRDPKQLTIDNG